MSKQRPTPAEQFSTAVLENWSYIQLVFERSTGGLYHEAYARLKDAKELYEREREDE